MSKPHLFNLKDLKIKESFTPLFSSLKNQTIMEDSTNVQTTDPTITDPINDGKPKAAKVQKTVSSTT